MSLATTPLTVPVPYETFHVSLVVLSVVDSWLPKVLWFWQGDDVHESPMTHVFAAPVSINMYMLFAVDPNCTLAKYDMSLPSSSMAIASFMSGGFERTTG